LNYWLYRIRVWAFPSKHTFGTGRQRLPKHNCPVEIKRHSGRKLSGWFDKKKEMFYSPRSYLGMTTGKPKDRKHRYVPMKVSQIVSWKEQPMILPKATKSTKGR